MTEKNKYSVKIGDMELNIVSRADESEVRNVAGIIDRKMKDIYQNSPKCPRHEAAVLCALDYCAQKLEVQDRNIRLECDLAKTKEELEKMKNQNEQLRAEISKLIEENSFVKQLLTKVSDEPAPLRVDEPAPTATVDDHFEQLSIESEEDALEKTPSAPKNAETAPEQKLPELIAPEDLADMGIANVLSDSARDKKRAERSKMGYMFDTLIHNNF
jgi:cell division protein ZapA (FtsZ GTPase activity inhibitor)